MSSLKYQLKKILHQMSDENIGCHGKEFRTQHPSSRCTLVEPVFG